MRKKEAGKERKRIAEQERELLVGKKKWMSLEEWGVEQGKVEGWELERINSTNQTDEKEE